MLQIRMHHADTFVGCGLSTASTGAPGPSANRNSQAIPIPSGRRRHSNTWESYPGPGCLVKELTSRPECSPKIKLPDTRSFIDPRSQGPRSTRSVIYGLARSVDSLRQYLWTECRKINWRVTCDDSELHWLYIRNYAI